MLLPGGAMLVLGAGIKGAREVMSLARAGAKDLGAVMEGSRIVRGLREAGTAVKDVLSIAGSKVKGWGADLIKGEGVLGNERGAIRLGRAEEDAGTVASVNPGRWRVGDPVDQLTAAGNEPSWSAVQRRVWKNEAAANPGRWKAEQLDLMRGGNVPRHKIFGVPMELHHANIPQRLGDPTAWTTSTCSGRGSMLTWIRSDTTMGRAHEEAVHSQQTAGSDSRPRAFR